MENLMDFGSKIMSIFEAVMGMDFTSEIVPMLIMWAANPATVGVPDAANPSVSVSAAGPTKISTTPRVLARCPPLR